MLQYYIIAYELTHLKRVLDLQSTLLSRSRRDPLKHFEISVLRHIRSAELRKIQIGQIFTNKFVI